MSLPGPLLDTMRRLVGGESLHLSPAVREQYAADGLPTHRGIPGAIVLPRSRAELLELARALAAHDVPFVARGAGTGLSGGAVAGERAVLVVLTRLNRLLELDPVNRSAVAEAGMVNQRITAAASGHRLHYAPDPSSQTVCTIGGNVAENAGGPHCLKYGVTTNHVLEMEVLLPDGTPVVLGSPGGDPWGPDLAGLFIGSEGLFGIVTWVRVRLTPSPRAVHTLLADFDSLRDAGAAVSAVIATGIVPAALEMMDRNAVRVVEDSVYRAGYPTDAEAVLLVELDGISDTAVAAEGGQVVGVLRAHGARSVRQASEAHERDRLWQGRKKTFGALGRLSRNFIVQDTVVPRTALPDVLERIAEIGARHRLTVANVFHAGDGNLHPNLAFDDREPDVLQRVEAAAGEIMHVCIAAGGTITGEHGVGLDKIRYMPLVFDPDTIATMHAVRRVFDPHARANPGKVLPEADGPTGGSTDRNAPIPADRRSADPPAVLRALLGADGVDGASDPPRAFPSDDEAVAAVLREASARGWKVRVEGNGTWMPPDAPADLVLATGRLSAIRALDPDDLVATAEAGVSWEALAERLAERRAWVALDPAPRRSVGAVVSCGVAGALRAGFGAPRDHVLGLTLVTGDGRVLRVGGRVMKNVAGFDLTRLAVGAYGGFGVITAATFRLRVLPGADRTVRHAGARDALLGTARRILAAGLSPAVLELESPEPGGIEWTLTMRFLGSEEETSAALGAASEAAGVPMNTGQAVGRPGGPRIGTGDVTLRLGARPSEIERGVDLLTRHLGADGSISVTVPVGAIRWSGSAHADAVLLLRAAAAEASMPVTLERAPWTVRSVAGEFGAYRAGVAPLLRGLRAVFDPAETLVTGFGSLV